MTQELDWDFIIRSCRESLEIINGHERLSRREHNLMVQWANDKMMFSFNNYPLIKLDAASVSATSSEQGHYDYIIVGGKLVLRCAVTIGTNSFQVEPPVAF